MKALFLFVLSLVPPADAHVKWFATNTNVQVPISLAGLNHASFWGLLLLSLVTIGLLAYVDSKFARWPAYVGLNKTLAAMSEKATVILRVFTGAALLLDWQSDALIAPELRISSGVGWLEFAIALLLLTSVTTPIAGFAMILAYFYQMHQYGFFHLLDYTFFPAIGYFLLVSRAANKSILNTRIPVLYVGMGFSLCWVALEKVFFPYWGLDVLRQQPELTMGLPADFFLLACAFVEMSLGYLLIIGLLQRPMALVISLVFFTTTVVFGKVEVIGHTILHGVLLVFIVVGPGGYYKPPIRFHKRLAMQAAFAAVNFVLVALVLGLAYWWEAS